MSRSLTAGSGPGRRFSSESLFPGTGAFQPPDPESPRPGVTTFMRWVTTRPGTGPAAAWMHRRVFARSREASRGRASADPGPGGARHARPGLLVLALSRGVTTLSMLQSLVGPVLGTIAGRLPVSAAAARWVLTANLLAAAVLTPVLG